TPSDWPATGWLPAPRARAASSLPAMTATGRGGTLTTHACSEIAEVRRRGDPRQPVTDTARTPKKASLKWTVLPRLAAIVALLRLPVVVTVTSLALPLAASVIVQRARGGVPGATREPHPPRGGAP